MNAALTINDFNALLSSDAEENTVLSALRKLMTLEKPEDVLAASEFVLAFWGWR